MKKQWNLVLVLILVLLVVIFSWMNVPDMQIRTLSFANQVLSFFRQVQYNENRKQKIIRM